MSQKSFLFTRPPLWQSQYRGLESKLPAELKSWLVETGSLTKRLRAHYGSSFAVTVLFNRWKPAYIDESRLLDLPPERYQLTREVMLTANGQPLVLARTIMPEQTIRIARRNLSHLGNRPLGEVIFAYPDLERRIRQYSRADIGLWPPKLQPDFGTEQSIWGRRTIYAIHHQPLLVAEFFLPGLFTR